MRNIKLKSNIDIGNCKVFKKVEKSKIDDKTGEKVSWNEYDYDTMYNCSFVEMIKFSLFERVYKLKRVSKAPYLEEAVDTVLTVAAYFNSVGRTTYWGNYSEKDYMVRSEFCGLFYPQRLTLFGHKDELSLIKPWISNAEKLEVINPEKFDEAQNVILNALKIKVDNGDRTLSDLRSEMTLTAELLRRCAIDGVCMDYNADIGIPITINHNFYKEHFIVHDVKDYVEEHLRSKLR